MATWQIAVLLLALVWALQSYGVWRQMRHYREALGDIEQRFQNGFVGTGFVRGRIARGMVALVVVDEHLIVERVAVMAGRSVFAKFRNHAEYKGLTLEDLRARAVALSASPLKDTRTLGGAIQQAVDQIDLVRARKLALAQPAQAAPGHAAAGQPVSATLASAAG